jgi:hypothetical protein
MLLCYIQNTAVLIFGKGLEINESAEIRVPNHLHNCLHTFFVLFIFSVTQTLQGSYDDFPAFLVPLLSIVSDSRVKPLTSLKLARYLHCMKESWLLGGI